MPEVFGVSMSKSELLTRVGDMSQVAGIRLATLADGRDEGVRVADFHTGTGFDFTVLVSRGLDIGPAGYCGRSLCWLAPVGIPHPAYFEPEGLGWLRTFHGGLVTTCGMTAAGAPSTDRGKELGLHGRVSNAPASRVAVSEGWEGDDYVLRLRGEIREAVIFGENLRLTREISTRLGETRFFIHDVVENLGYQTTEHMFLYHINGGFPAVEAGSELVSPTKSVRPRDAEAEKEKEKYAQLPAPQPGFLERCYYHEMAPDADGMVTTALLNRQAEGGRGFGFYARYRLAELPRFTEWKMVGQGTYVVGMEPANCSVEGRAKERERGTLQFLEPGEKREYRVEIGVLRAPDQIAALDQAVKRALAGG